MNSYNEISKCRISGSENLVSVLNLGYQSLTGVFPKNTDESVTKGPLELVWCSDSGLLQLRHSYEPSEMYGDNYGYRSGLNQSMVNHLTDKVAYLERFISSSKHDVIVDIGSNDATTLKAYKTEGVTRIGIDPTGKKFLEYYPPDIQLVPDFFSSYNYQAVESRPAKIITSIAMFYDLEAPIEFAKQIESILADDGIWHFEQSYMPSMLRTNSYDTICHEHLEFYSLAVIEYILKKSGMKVFNVTLNDINGFHVRAEHVARALEGAAGGPVAEGNVGGGTGMICHEFKCGIGTASRRARVASRDYTVGVLVQANYGLRDTLRIAGVPVGQHLREHRVYSEADPQAGDTGSIIIVVGTDAPLLPHQLERIARRAALGLARMGSVADNGSGDFFLAFSTVEVRSSDAKDDPTVTVPYLPNDELNPLFAATVFATEEAIVNAMVAARDMQGNGGKYAKAIPHAELRKVLQQYGRLIESR